MRRFAASAVVLAAPLAAAAQVSPAPTGGFQMPGTTIGQPLLQPVGTQIKKAVPQAAPPVGSAPSGTVPADLTGSLPGQTIDLSNVVGPLPDSFSTPAQASAWTKFLATLGFVAPEPKAPNWTPGISRRNRERAQERNQAWRRD